MKYNICQPQTTVGDISKRPNPHAEFRPQCLELHDKAEALIAKLPETPEQITLAMVAIMFEDWIFSNLYNDVDWYRSQQDDAQLVRAAEIRAEAAEVRAETAEVLAKVAP